VSDEPDFDPEELAMLRQLFRSEAQDALDLVTARVLAAGSAKPSPDALTEMMRVTHTLKGAAGTVGLPAVVELSHQLESAFAEFGRDAPWTATTADQIVEIVDGLRGYLDVAGEPGSDQLVAQVRDQIGHLARRIERRRDSMIILPEPTLETAPVEPKAWLRVEPERIDGLMSSAGELLFDRTRSRRPRSVRRRASRRARGS
jgi:two-component system, chemotaxis family, sensor kinase CheA